MFERQYALAPEAVARRFWDAVEFDSDCWLWTGSTIYSGYGIFYTGSTQVMAHRWAYEHVVEPIPDGLELDHLCRVRNCVNPDHLEAVTHTENVRRGSMNGPQVSHCPQGHEYTDDNTYVYTKANGATSRHCKTCTADRTRAARQRQKTTR